MELRPITADDLPVVHRLHRRAETFDNIPAVTSMDDLRSFIDGVQTTMATDTRLAEIGNAVVGYVHTFHLPSEVRLERCYVFGQVDPAHRRHGIGTELLRWGLERAENLLRSSGSSLPKFIRTDHYDFVDGPRQLFTSMGLKPVRFHDQMRRSLEVLPPAVELDGIAIVPWPAERNAEVREVKNVAFADHWGSTPTSPEFWE
ncbi:MAG: GNAT family N-acetyltransferase, partial [Acidimicrobiia bacterium]|nr:GNAT family N-acetyltransferase [Acidimicrobiia bacterium]